MAVTTSYSSEYQAALVTTPLTKQDPAVWHGKLRFAEFTCTQSGAGDATSSFAVVKLPPGKVTLLGDMSYAYVNWTTSLAKLDCGWDAYTDLDGNAVAADVDGLDDGVDVDAAGAINFCSVLATSGKKKTFESKDGVVIRISSTDVAIADTDTAKGYFVYVQG